MTGILASGASYAPSHHIQLIYNDIKNVRGTHPTFLSFGFPTFYLFLVSTFSYKGAGLPV
jgi:hypothetical protein